MSKKGQDFSKKITEGDSWNNSQSKLIPGNNTAILKVKRSGGENGQFRHNRASNA
jgi:hypothetical protein